ncbi:MAG: hypothetical protein M1144_02680 [Candidatus Thermoplasmatota archaeon]|jgi:hypothetical protein|nr:hypothetical protein [Candidatus Thermoplasmatota archaeon]
MGEAGSGHNEFSLTSASRITYAIDEPVEGSSGFHMGAHHDIPLFPNQVTYVSFTRSREETMAEIRHTFPPYYPLLLSKHLNYIDLSGAYFADSIVPPEWSRSKRSILDGNNSTNESILSTMARELESRAKNSLVIIESLSDLLARSTVNKEDVVTLVKGLRRRAKDWRGLIYILLARNVAEHWIEEALKDSVDGVLSFGWVQNPHKSARLRAMWIEKSMPLLAHVPPERQGRFIINVSGSSGLVTTQYERID